MQKMIPTQGVMGEYAEKWKTHASWLAEGSLHIICKPVVCSQLKEDCIYRQRGKQKMACYVQVMPFDGGSVNVWGGIYGQERTPLVIVNGNRTAQHYIDDVLRPTISPTASIWYYLSAWHLLWSQQHQHVAVASMLARHVPNRTPMRCHGSSCLTTSTQQEPIQAIQREWLTSDNWHLLCLTMFTSIEAKGYYTRY